MAVAHTHCLKLNKTTPYQILGLESTSQCSLNVKIFAPNDKISFPPLLLHLPRSLVMESTTVPHIHKQPTDSGERETQSPSPVPAVNMNCAISGFYRPTGQQYTSDG